MNNTLCQNILECYALAKSFKQGSERIDVLRDITFQIKRGEQVAIIGSSGSGKSTLLHLLGGLDIPNTGSIYLNGHELNSICDTVKGKLRNLLLGFIYQFHHLLMEFSILENVSMPLLLRGEPIDQVKDKTIDFLKKVGLGNKLHHKPSELSGGERQRAAVARALVTNPACVLADEPTGNLDQNSARSVFDLMLDLNTSSNTSLIIVTHDLELAAKTGNVWRLLNGVLTK